GEQMRLLFAVGRHPLADTGPVPALGVPSRTSTVEQPFLAALRARFADHNIKLGLPRHAALPVEVRARLRGELAAEWFRQREGRDPEGCLGRSFASPRGSRVPRCGRSATRTWPRWSSRPITLRSRPRCGSSKTG